MAKLIGIIQKDGRVKAGKSFFCIPVRGTDKEGYPEVLMDARPVGGSGFFSRQSIKPYIGMKVEFLTINDMGYNYRIKNA